MDERMETGNAGIETGNNGKVGNSGSTEASSSPANDNIASGNGKTKRKDRDSAPSTTRSKATKSGNQDAKILEIPVLNEPKKPKVKKVTIADKELSDNINMLLQVSFNFASLRLGDHWKITEEESKLIADPSSRILKRLGVNKAVSKYMDYFTLLTASAIIIVPRVMITNELKKGESKDVKSGTPKANNNSISNGKPKEDAAAGNVKSVTENVVESYNG